MLKTTLLKLIAVGLLVGITFYSCKAQEFDRTLEKDIKTEINLNRNAKSQAPLYLSSYHKTACDSITMIALRSYLANTTNNSLGAGEDWEKIWAPVDQEMTKYFAHYNIVVIKDGDYKSELKHSLFDKQSYFYKLENSEMSLSALRYDGKIFLTVLTW